jgi:hypothetical protein
MPEQQQGQLLRLRSGQGLRELVPIYRQEFNPSALTFATRQMGSAPRPSGRLLENYPTSQAMTKRLAKTIYRHDTRANACRPRVPGNPRKNSTN